MAQKFANNFITTLTGNILAADLSLPLATVAGLPGMGVGDYFYGALVNASNQVEFFIATAIVGNNLTIPPGGRGLGGSTARNYTAGDTVRAVLIREALQQLQQESLTSVVATGTDNYTAIYAPVLRGLVAGVMYCLTIANTNTVTTPTITFNSLVPVFITLQNGAALSAGQIPKEGMYRYDGTNLVLLNPVNPITNGLIPPGASIDFMGTVIPSGFLAEDGSNQLIATYPALYAALVRVQNGATITIAAPGVVTWNAHGLSSGDVVKFRNNADTLPTGLALSTNYFVLNPTANTFQLSATEGGAAINTTGVQAGVHVAVHAPHGDGDGITTFTLPDTRRRTLVGRGGAPNSVLGARLGATGGEDSHVLTIAEIPAHDHPYSAAINTGTTAFVGANDLPTAVSTNTGATGGGLSHNNIQQSLVVTKMIKT